MIVFLSKTGYVYACLKIADPPAKPKYFYIIDSEKVPWGKAEKVLSLKGQWKESEIFSKQAVEAFYK